MKTRANGCANQSAQRHAPCGSPSLWQIRCTATVPGCMRSTAELPAQPRGAVTAWRHNRTMLSLVPHG